MNTTDHWPDMVTLYKKISADWYVDCPSYIAPHLKRLSEQGSDSDGYCHSTNTIQLNAPVREIDMPDIDSLLEVCGQYTSQAPRWEEWKKVVVHEAIHEYEKKEIGEHITDAGKQLFAENKSKNFMPPDKHGYAFYSAVADRATYFNMTPQVLVDYI